MYLRFTRTMVPLAVLGLLAALIGCGGGGSPVGNGPGLGNGDKSGLLQGQYAFSISGQNTANGALVVVAGSFTADGNGRLSGTEDVNSHLGVHLVTFGGSYAIGADGRGNAVLGIDPGCPNWQLTMVSHAHGFFTCMNTDLTASGTIDLQDSSAFSTSKLTGNYVFGLSGLGLPTTTSSGGLVVMAGDWTMDGNGNLTGEMDVNDIGGVLQDVALSGTYSVAADGRGTATIASAYATQKFAFYIVNASDVKFVEIDSQPVVSGEVLTQAASPFNLGVLNGTYAFTVGGTDSNNNPATLGGVFTADGKGTISTGLLDSNDAGVVSLGNPATGTYGVNATGRGLLTFTSPSLQLAFYAAANGTIELVDVDGKFGVAGMAKRQTGGPFAPSSFAGNYAINLTGTNLSSGEEDISGQLQADGAGNLNGVLDINNSGSLFQAVSLSSSSYAINADGRGSASINTGPGNFATQVYVIDRNTALFLDADTGRVLAGLAEKQQF